MMVSTFYWEEILGEVVVSKANPVSTVHVSWSRGRKRNSMLTGMDAKNRSAVDKFAQVTLESTSWATNGTAGLMIGGRFSKVK